MRVLVVARAAFWPAAAAALVLSALLVVVAKHESRKLFVELQGLERVRDELNVNWGRLKLESGYLASHDRVRDKAVRRLGMDRPRSRTHGHRQPRVLTAMRIPQSKRPGIGVKGLGRPRGPLPLRWRVRLVMAALAVSAFGLLGKALYLQMNQGDFLRDEGAARHVRTVSSHAPRGVIRDRHGTALAMSTAIESIWVDPREAVRARERWPALAAAIGFDPSEVDRKLMERADRSFVYLRRHVDPDTAARVRSLAVPGVYFEREFRRYYPEAEVVAHVVGFTDIDGVGQEGVEFAYDSVLRGVSGAKQVIQDRLGRSVEDVQNVRSARPGRDVYLTLDLRLQSLAYRALKAAVVHHEASAGSVVVVDAGMGEIHAMVNQPSYNPNDPAKRSGPATRTGRSTDVFEPGSTVKPFAVTAALESGAFDPRSEVDTSPGYLQLGRNVVRDGATSAGSTSRG